MTTTFAEFQSIKDFSITFEVEFMGEVTRDYGDPQKEWIHLMNSAVKEKYFENGLGELLLEDHYHVDVMMEIALLQNGQLPTILQRFEQIRFGKNIQVQTNTSSSIETK